MRRRSLADDQRAAVYVEFLVVFMPLFMLFLGLTQTSLLFTGKIVVQHAADAACRSAIVVLPDDPGSYDGRAKNQIEFNETTLGGGGVQDAVEGIANLLGIDLPTNLLAAGDPRLNRIRLAAFRPLLAIIPPPDAVFDLDNPMSLSRYAPGEGESAQSVLIAVGHGRGMAAAGKRFAAGLLYLSQAAAVTFPSGPGAGGVNTSGTQDFAYSRGSHLPLTTRVSYSYPCLVPGAAQIMCDSWSELSGNQAEGWNEMNGALARGTALLNGGGVYYILRADATLTYQGAEYQYRSEREGG
ncbi:MAG: pilus assembly protein [Deltaproteobacteria bacterium]|nr:pilus assembly protein [Deltaproteobacteria bacterium]